MDARVFRRRVACLTFSFQVVNPISFYSTARNALPSGLGARRKSGRTGEFIANQSFLSRQMFRRSFVGRTFCPLLPRAHTRGCGFHFLWTPASRGRAL